MTDENTLTFPSPFHLSACNMKNAGIPFSKWWEAMVPHFCLCWCCVDFYDIRWTLLTNANFFSYFVNLSISYCLCTGSGVDLWIAVTRGSRFAKANFHTGRPIKSFYVVDASDSQVSLRQNKSPKNYYTINNCLFRLWCALTLDLT